MLNKIQIYEYKIFVQVKKKNKTNLMNRIYFIINDNPKKFTSHNQA